MRSQGNETTEKHAHNTGSPFSRWYLKNGTILVSGRAVLAQILTRVWSQAPAPPVFDTRSRLQLAFGPRLPSPVFGTRRRLPPALGRSPLPLVLGRSPPRAPAWPQSSCTHPTPVTPALGSRSCLGFASVFRVRARCEISFARAEVSVDLALRPFLVGTRRPTSVLPDVCRFLQPQFRLKAQTEAVAALTTMEPSDIAKFWNEGYVVGRTNEVFTEALVEVQDLDFDPIFGDIYDETGEGDPNRLQSTLETLGDAMTKIHDAIECIMENSDDQWEIRTNSWNALKSLAGGGRQHPHKDFPTFETSKALITKQSVQASVIVGLMPGTRFIVSPRRFGSLVDIDEAKVLVLDVGDILIFRGDLVHAGADFDINNIRLYCHVLVKGIEQKEDSTEAAAFATYLCGTCLLMCESRRDLSNHTRTCGKKGSSDEKRSDRQASSASDEGTVCEDCGKHFRLKNSYYQHKRRKKLKRMRNDNKSAQDDSSSE